MIRYRCPDCDQFHRGRCMVCRPCARVRLIRLAHSRSVSRETNDNITDQMIDLAGPARELVEAR